MGEEVLKMTRKEADRLSLIRQTIEGNMTWAQAAKRLGITERHVGRLCARIRVAGSQGAIHGLRGRISNRRLDDTILSQAVSSIEHPLWDGFGPTFARDKLIECYGLRLGLETVRQLMIASGAWTPGRSGPRHRAWRPRRACVGMLVQMDGSDHDWLEGRGPRFVLLMLIDDATGLILYAEFVDSESTMNVFRAVKAYLRRHGRCLAFYVDKDSIFRVNTWHDPEEEERPATQFGRAMAELGIEVIWAHSPQAKGRVERSFKTHQDRLVKELRLAGISTMAAANTFLQRTYVPQHNRRYAVAPIDRRDAHRPLLEDQNLDRILSIRTTRVLQNNFTVRFGKLFLQLLPTSGVRLRPKDRVVIEIRLDGSRRLSVRDAYVRHTEHEHPPHTPFYATNREGAWPTEAEARRSTPGQSQWLWAWAKRDQAYVDDSPALPTSAGYL